MRKQKKNSKNVKRLRGCAVLLLCGLLVCGMLAGCSKADEQKDTQNTGSPVEAEDILIQTSYGTLHYPGNWQEYVTIRQEQSGSAILALRLAMFVIPNVLALVQVILSCMYPLSQEKMEEVNTELEMRHSNPNHVPVDVQL